MEKDNKNLTAQMNGLIGYMSSLKFLSQWFDMFLYGIEDLRSYDLYLIRWNPYKI